MIFPFVILLWCALGLMVCPQANIGCSTLYYFVKVLFSQLCCLPSG